MSHRGALGAMDWARGEWSAGAGVCGGGAGASRCSVHAVSSHTLASSTCRMFGRACKIKPLQYQDKLHPPLQGPKDTPFEGGTFELAISVPEQYPLVPPGVRYRTKIFHPNVHFKVRPLLCCGCVHVTTPSAPPFYHLCPNPCTHIGTTPHPRATRPHRIPAPLRLPSKLMN